MKIIAFTGAGISKASGISTFMEQPEVRDKLHRSFAIKHPKQYNEVIKEMKRVIDLAKPNDAHHALAEYDVDIITMNIDGLHEACGSKPLCLHGMMPKTQDLDIAYKLVGSPVLYGDQAPNYMKAVDEVLALEQGDVFLVIGASHSTMIAIELRNIALSNQVRVIEIQRESLTEVRKTLEALKGKIQ